MYHKFFKSIFLIIGTAIGAGILSLPISTVNSGFFGSVLSLLFSAIFMVNAAYYIIIVRLSFKEEVDLANMVKKMLGNKVKFFTEIIYLMLLFALISVYTIVGSSWSQTFMAIVFKLQIPSSLSQLFFLFLITLILFSGINNLTFINYFISLLMLISLGIIIFLSFSNIQIKNINSINLREIPFTFSMVLTSFGFGSIIPSIVKYTKFRQINIVKIILFGSIMIFVTYFMWNLAVFGVLGNELILLSMIEEDQGLEIVESLGGLLSFSFFYKTGFIFMFLATLSSLLGVGQSLYYYLQDTLPIRIEVQKVCLSLFIFFIVPIIIINFFPKSISYILSLGGIFIAIIQGIIPTLMVLSSPYQKYIGEFNIGNKVLAVLSLIFFIVVIIIQLFTIVYI